MHTLPFSNPSGQTIQRDQFVSLVQMALFMGQTRFAGQAALAWLAAYPGDLPVNLIYAQILLKEGRPVAALPILAHLAQTDPEYLEAAKTRLEAEIRLETGNHNTTRTAASLPKSLRQKQQGMPLAEVMGCVLALGGKEELKVVYTGDGMDRQSKSRERSADATSAVWSQQVRQARLALEQYQGSTGRALEPKSARSLEQADQLLIPALAAELQTALVAVTHLRILRARATPAQSLSSITEHFLRRWPDCVQFQLILAEALMSMGQSDRAVGLLHQAAAGDLTGQVAARLWGEHHPYHALWPQRLEIGFDLAIPAPVAAAMGWNQLPEMIFPAAFRPAPKKEPTPPGAPATWGTQVPRATPVPWGTLPKSGDIEGMPQPKTRPAIPETLIAIQNELEHLADRLNQPGLARSDGRFPVYVLLSTRQGLHAQYGDAAKEIEVSLQKLTQAVQARRDWRAMLFYADEGLPPDVQPARYNDPWSIKLTLTDLDAALWKNGEMIGAVLVVGGPEVVPFHHLPNPVDDADDDVPSDNPYGTRDENYFIPEWPVGRLPGGAGSNAAPLVKAINKLADRHQAVQRKQQRRSLLQRWLQKLFGWIRADDHGSSHSLRKQPSFGYTAAAWKRASLSVFQPIGQPRALRVSPPLGIEKNPPTQLPSARLGYFNLHGLVDAVEWYGQTDPTEPVVASEGYTEFPVAVRPQDVVNSGHAPEVVFSEACYGAHILGKTIDQALALKFLQAGSQAVVGSTCTAYGSINTPLTAADFLGHSFWAHVRQGISAGEALRRAKLALALEMHRRQGYLDGEDQKTLISFVLYGDPLAQPVGQSKEPKGTGSAIRPPKGVRTVCDRARQQDTDTPVPAEVTQSVRQIVEHYLPGMKDAELSLSREHSECGMAGHACPTSQLRVKSNPTIPGGSPPPPQRRVVILSKQVRGREHTHKRYARITLDDHNRMVKLVISR